MSQTIITARIHDQAVQLSNLALIASGSKGVLQIKCEFDSNWSGYGKTAVFYKDESEVYHVPLVSGLATVPNEILADKGYFYFGLIGVAGNTRTTEVVRLAVEQGAITTETAQPEEPTPDIYSAIMDSYGQLDARMNEMVAMRGEGTTEYLVSDEYINGTIRSNGSSAYVELTITGLSLIAGGYHYSDYCILPGAAPLGPVELKSSNPDLDITMEAASAENGGWARLLIENPSSAMYTTDMVTTCSAFYPLAAPFNSELADIRAGQDGVNYATAGAAVREQFRKVNENPGSGSGSGSGTVQNEVIYEDVLINEANKSYENVTFKGNVTIQANHVSLRNCVMDDSAKQLLIDGDYASLTGCVIYAKTTIGTNGTTLTGNESVATDCNFFNIVEVNGAHVQIKNASFGGTSSKNYLVAGRGALKVNEDATDIIVSDFTVSNVRGCGVYFHSYGGILTNFTIRGCSKQGLRILSGSCQVENGKIFYCGPTDSKADEWTGGLLAKAPTTGGYMQYIPELNIQNVSIQQNFGYGVWLEKVINSNVNISLMANCSNRFPYKAEAPYVNEHKVFMKPAEEAYSTYLHYGMALYDCKNVSGIVNGISCHTHWNGADKGYYDNVPSLNSINVTWESTYSNDDTFDHKNNPRYFARFLPEVRAEIVNGLRIGNQFTEADCDGVAEMNYADIPLVADDGYLAIDDEWKGSKIIPVSKDGKVPITGKGTVRLYVEAPELNIYPCVYIRNAANEIIYSEEFELGKQLNNVMARGMHNVYSGTFCYDTGDTDLTGAARFELCVHFNRIDPDLTGAVKPKIRAQFYPI